MPLEEYRRKRDFGRTPEPAGESIDRVSDGRLIYVVQKHAARQLHYDLRLELDDVLKSWAVPKGPSLDPKVKRLAMHVEDHPIEYADFEGVIPKGEYGGGTVLLWDSGTWEPIGDVRADYRRGRLKFAIHGEKLQGAWTLVRIRGEDGGGDPWLLIKETDDKAVAESERDITADRPDSVATGRDLEEIAADRDRVWHSDRGREDGGGEAGVESASAGVAATRARLARITGSAGHATPDPTTIAGATEASLPERPSPQLASASAEVPTGDDWLHEIKLDGYRVLLRIQDGVVRVSTRNGKDWTDRFQGLAAAASALPCESALIDGEAVVLDERGVSRFGALQQALGRAGSSSRIVCFAFDLLHLDGYDLTAVQLLERKSTLRSVLPASDVLLFSDHVRGNGRAFYQQACSVGLEGVVSKRADAPYRAGRSRAWRKIKCQRRQEFVVVGYTEPSGSRKGFGALVLAVNKADGLTFCGRVGTGFTERTLEQLHEQLIPLERETAPVINPPTGALAKGVHWIEPDLVAEVEFIEWTADGLIRHASYQGLREDKDPSEVVREDHVIDVTTADDGQADGGASPVGSPDQTARRPRSGRSNRPGGKGDPVVAGVRITNPTKLLYPDDQVSKLDVVRYWEAVADVALPFLVDRPLTLYRCPNGIREGGFFQKHAGDGTPDVVPRVKVEGEDYLKIDGESALIALVQLGVLEFHVWGARADRLDRPDRIVFDLDPDEDLAWTEVVSAAVLLRDYLAAIGLDSFVKTTGGKGLHVMLPIERRSTWDEVKEFTRVVAEGFAAASPDRFTDNMSKRRRQGRIFLDYLRNQWNATAVCAYSTRSRPGAPVSVPLSWDELERLVERPDFTVRNVPDRVADVGDPWPGFDDVRQALTKKVLKQVGLT